MSELIKNPRVMKKVQAEVRETLKGKKNSTIDHSDIQNMKYMKFVVKGSRLHPPGPLALPRESREAMQWEEITEHWHDPEKFEPERFKFVDDMVKSENSIPPEFVGFAIAVLRCGFTDPTNLTAVFGKGGFETSSVVTPTVVLY
ncbi:hypothetical protein HAX54_008633 [Datura stramonium]|uniref:Cytochrome P450 n=1 Tax=Datura stramonium TaxID=4076 RepID=A0ABS8TDI7_DATST|nr:hypothetical protein [Datura stramonium]